VDLGGLSASLFTPNPSVGRDLTSPASTATTVTTLGGGAAAGSGSDGAAHYSTPSSPDVALRAGARHERRAGGSNGPAHLVSVPSSFDQVHFPAHSGGVPGAPSASGAGLAAYARVSISPRSPMAAIPPPWGVTARESAAGEAAAGGGGGGGANLQSLAARPLSSRGRPVQAANGVDAGAAAAAPGTPTGGAARSGSRGGTWMRHSTTNPVSSPAPAAGRGWGSAAHRIALRRGSPSRARPWCASARRSRWAAARKAPRRPQRPLGAPTRAT
jgi:hypothetical protein